MTKFFNQITFKIHSWLGLFNGVWLLIFGITGSLLVYSNELDKWINKDVPTVALLERLCITELGRLYKIQYR